MAAYCYVWRRANGWMDDRKGETAECVRLAWRAVELGRDDAVTLCWSGFALARVAGDLDGGPRAHRPCALAEPEPGRRPGTSAGGCGSTWASTSRQSRHLAQAMRLSPLDPLLFGMQGATAFAHFFLGRHEGARAWAEKARRENPNFLPVLGIAAASNALAGRMEAARSAVERLRAIDPAAPNIHPQRPHADPPPAGPGQVCGRPAAGGASGLAVATACGPASGRR